MPKSSNNLNSPPKTQSLWASFGIIILCGILLRFYVAVKYLNIIYPDEQFQTLEPASWTIFGFGWKSWEWYHGIRSWFVPALYMPVLAILKAVGINGGPISIQACRLLNAGFSGVALWQFHKLLEQKKLHGLARLCTMMLLSFSTAMIVWSATTFAETWCLCFLWISLPVILKAVDDNNIRKIFWGGLILGLSFMARIQMVPWALGLGLCLFLSPKGRSLLPSFIAGYLVPVFAQGLLDWATWGFPFYSAYKNILMNLFQGVAAANGTSPWFAYFAMIYENLQWPLLLALLGIPLAAGLYRPIGLGSWLDSMNLKIFFPTLVFILVHMAIGHKETRFLLPALPTLFYFFCIGLNHLVTTYEKTSDNMLASFSVGHVFFVSVLLSCTTLPFLFNEHHFDKSDTSELALRVQEDGLLKKYPDKCLLFVDHYWIWARGEMLQGHKVLTKEIRLSDLKPEQLNQCAYAIMPGWTAEEFQERASNTHWQKIATNPWGHVLFKDTWLR